MAGDETERIPPPDATLLALAPGRRLFERDTLAAIAGRGGMGVVWRALHGVSTGGFALRGRSPYHK